MSVGEAIKRIQASNVAHVTPAEAVNAPKMPTLKVSLTHDVQPVHESFEKVATRSRACLEGLHK